MACLVNYIGKTNFIFEVFGKAMVKSGMKKKMIRVHNLIQG